jgi:hypothetical protein
LLIFGMQISIVAKIKGPFYHRIFCLELVLLQLIPDSPGDYLR